MDLLSPNAISELTKSIVNGIGIGFLSCIGIGIVKSTFQVLVLVLLKDAQKSIGYHTL